MDTNFTESYVAPKIDNAVSPVCRAVPYGDQKVGGYLGNRLDLNYSKNLLGFPVGDYLAPYARDMIEHWPSGEYLGKHMQAIVSSFLYNGSEELFERLKRIVATWKQNIPEDGYLTVKDSADIPRWQGDWEVWELKYDLIGLCNYYSITGDEDALDVGRKIGDLLCREFGSEPGKIDLPSVGALRLGTMSLLEGMVYLYRYTGEKRYLDFCNYMMEAHESDTGTAVLSEMLSGSRDVAQIGGVGEQNGSIYQGAWNKGKAYEEMATFIGVLRMYQLTGCRRYLQAMIAAWEDVRKKRTIIGTGAHREFFRHDRHKYGDPGDTLGEGCVTAHWIYFSRTLFFLTGDLRYIDEIELTTYNALLGSQDPHECKQSYFLELNGRKAYADFSVQEGGPPCCLTSVQREVAWMPESLWGTFGPSRVAVLLYNSGEATVGLIDDRRLRGAVDAPRATDAARGESSRDSALVTLALDTDFPAEGGARLTINSATEVSFTVSLRVPPWVTRFVATVGRERYIGVPGRFLDIQRIWNPGDLVEIDFDLPVLLVDGEDSYPFHYAVRRGVQVLGIDEQVIAGDQELFQVRRGATDSVVTSIPGAEIVAGSVELDDASDRLPDSWEGEQAYVTAAVIDTAGEEAVLVPFSEIGQLQESRYRIWIRGEGAPTERWTTIQDTDPRWERVGAVETVSDEKASTGTLTFLHAGCLLSIDFSGQKVKVIGYRGPKLTLGDIQIDGEVFRDEKWIELGDKYQTPIFVSPLYAPGTHRLTITARDEITLDCIEIMGFER